MDVSREELQKYAIHMSEGMENNDGSRHHTSVGPSMLNPLHFINVLRYLNRDRFQGLYENRP